MAHLIMYDKTLISCLKVKYVLLVDIILFDLLTNALLDVNILSYIMIYGS